MFIRSLVYSFRVIFSTIKLLKVKAEKTVTNEVNEFGEIHYCDIKLLSKFFRDPKPTFTALFFENPEL